MIDIEALAGEGGTTCCYWARGHLDKNAFQAALDDQWGYYKQELTVSDQELIKHTWWRWVPAPKDCDWSTNQYPAEPGTRGAFRVTCVESVDITLIPRGEE